MAFIPITDEDLSRVREHIRGTLSEARAMHIFGVEEMAVQIGSRLLPEKLSSLRLAALLHDITKEWSYDANLSYLEANAIPLAEDKRRTPAILHALSGAYFAKERYPQLVDDEIFFAILRHTTGDAEMTLFEMIVYVSDLIEMGRQQPFCVNLRNEFFIKADTMGWETALEEVFLSSLRSTILSFAEKKRILAPESIAAYNSILFRQGENFNR